MKKILLPVLLIFLLSHCNLRDGQSDEDRMASLYLPDLNALDPLYETVDSTQAYGKLAYKILEENRDLQASQMYIEAAWFYQKAGMQDSTLYMLHSAIDRGMANPKILQKFPGLSTDRQDPDMDLLLKRLDSIQNELQEVSHFSLEMDAINSFWPYFEKALEDTVEAKDLFKEFIFKGPREVRDFYVARYHNTDNMYGQMINGTPHYYQYLRKYLNADSLNALNSTTTSWMRRFKSYYPQAVFPKVYIVPGILNTGGTTTEMGMFVGGDMYGRSDKMPTRGLTDWQNGAIMKFEDLPGLTIHELMHFQQSYADEEQSESVLMGIIGEGVCDFLVELCSGKNLENDNLRYLNIPENKEFILSELRSDLFSTDNSKWLYNGGSIEDRPHDLGYTLGYLITKSYYNNQEDKKKAIYDLLNTDDVVSILKGSDYAFLLEPELENTAELIR
ncbi:MAG: hypothetical protein WBM43_07975 [Flavobacteriaceae bacterium]